MPVNKNQELYFATVVFMLLTIHFGGNAINHLEAANEIEENCIPRCTSFEDELISEFKWNGFYSLVTAGIIAICAWFFWPEKTDEEREKEEEIFEANRRNIEAKRAEKEKKLFDQKTKQKMMEQELFQQAFISGDLTGLSIKQNNKYKRYAEWADKQENLVMEKNEYQLRKHGKNLDEYLKSTGANEESYDEE